MRIILGSAQFGLRYGLKKTKINKKEFQKIYKTLKYNSLTYFDTAINYGSSQKRIGTLNIKKKVITKIKVPTRKPKNLEKWYYQILFRTLKELKVKKLYGLLFHDISDIFKNDKKLLNIILKSKKMGLVSKVGISVYDVNEINQVLKIWKPDIVQLPINVFDHRLLKKNSIKRLKKKKIEIHVRSCFLQGLLLEPKLKRGNLNSKLIFKKFIKWCKEKKVDQLTACLHFIKKIKHIDAVIVGFDNSKQLSESLLSFRKKLVLVPDDFANNEKKLIDPRKWKIN